MISMYASTVSMRVFMPSFMRCLRSPWRDSSHGMSSGRTTFFLFALRAGICSAWSSSAWYSAWFCVPFFHAFDSPHAMVVLLYLFRFRFVVEVVFALARLEALPARGRKGRARFHLLLEQHVHEHVHGLGLDDERARRLRRARVEMLVH